MGAYGRACPRTARRPRPDRDPPLSARAIRGRVRADGRPHGRRRKIVLEHAADADHGTYHGRVEANYDWTVVRVSGDEGLLGWGEAFCAPGSARDHPRARAAHRGPRRPARRASRPEAPPRDRPRLGRRNGLPRDLGNRVGALGSRCTLARGSALAALRRVLPRPRADLCRLPRGRRVDELQRDARLAAPPLDGSRATPSETEPEEHWAPAEAGDVYTPGGVCGQCAGDGGSWLHGAQVRPRPPSAAERGSVCADDLGRPARAPGRDAEAAVEAVRAARTSPSTSTGATHRRTRSGSPTPSRACRSSGSRARRLHGTSRRRADRRAHDDADLHGREPLPPPRLRGARRAAAASTSSRRTSRKSEGSRTRSRIAALRRCSFAARRSAQHRGADRDARVGSPLRLDPEPARARVACGFGAVLRRARHARPPGDRGRLRLSAGRARNRRRARPRGRSTYARPGEPFFDEPPR